MAQIRKLEDRESKATIYPITVLSAVFDATGRDLERRFALEREVTDAALADKASAEQLAAKQDKLASSADILISGSQLSLTEKAKLALFDDEWTAAGGTVIESGVTYGLNGLNDLTYKEAIEIYALYPLCKARFTNRGGQFAGLNVRTLPPINTDSFFATNYMETFISSKLVTIKFITASNNPIVVISNAQNMFKNCTSLKCVYDTLNFPSGCNISGVFDLCPNLEEVRIKKLTNSIVLSFSPKLSLDSIAYMVENAANTTPITITLHPNVYARVTEELFVHAAEKNITIAST